MRCHIIKLLTIEIDEIDDVTHNVGVSKGVNHVHLIENFFDFKRRKIGY